MPALTLSLVKSSGFRMLPLLLASFGLLLSAPSVSRGEGAITKLRVDRSAEQVELFAALKDGRLTHRIAARDEFSAKVFLTNTTSQPLTVEIPPVLGAVPVLKQAQSGNGFFDFTGLPINDDTTSGEFQNVVGQSSDASGSPLGLPGNMGLNFFSIPPEKTVQFMLRSVCAEPGQRSPNVKVTYALVPLEKLTTSPVVRELLASWNARETSRQVMQASIWNQLNGLEWSELAQRSISRGPITFRAFGRGQLRAARALVEQTNAGLKQDSTAGRDVAETSSRTTR
ncbi:MAG: hypothetical protein KDA79_13205 [Planctomycetaceae bacterium]|nr:hypothetical protein [Planctomycetaceae bacterium]